MLGELNAQEIEEVLTSQIVGRIGCHGNGITYIVPVSYAYDGNCVYGRTLEGMKLDIMRKNPDVCFEVEDITSMAHWKSVIAWGKFEELTDTEKRNKAIQRLVDRVLPITSSESMHLSPQWPFPPNDIGSIKGIFFCIHLHEKTGRFETDIVTEP